MTLSSGRFYLLSIWMSSLSRITDTGSVHFKGRDSSKDGMLINIIQEWLKKLSRLN